MKSTGVRSVALPAVLVQVVRDDLAGFPVSGDELIIRGPLDTPLRRNNFRRSTWLSRAG